MSPAQAVAEASGGIYVPVVPTRIMDTSAGTGTTKAPMGATSTRNVTVLGVAGVPMEGVSAVVVDVAVKNVTVTGSSYLKVWRNGAPMPASATMFYTAANSTRSNTAIVEVGSTGKISIYSFAGGVDVDVDVQGYFTTASNESSTGGFVPISPTRVANSLTGEGVPQATLAVGASVDVQIVNQNEIPSTATAVFANVEVASNSSGNLRIGKGGQSATGVPPTVNYQDNGPTSSGVILPLSADGRIRILNSYGGWVNFKVDIQGYFSGRPDEGGSFTSLDPANLYISTSAGNTPLEAGETRVLQAAGVAGIPADGRAGSAVVTVTARNWTADGTITVFSADDEEAPVSTNLNLKAGEGVPSNGSSTTAIVQLSGEGEIAIRNTSAAPVTFYVSTQGWFSQVLPPETACTVWLNENHEVDPDLPINHATCDGDLAVEMLQGEDGTISYRVTNVQTGAQQTGPDLETLRGLFEQVVEPDEADLGDDDVVEDPDGPNVSDPDGPPADGVTQDDALESDPSSGMQAAATTYSRSRSTTKYFARYIGNNLVTQGWVRVSIRVTIYWHSASLRIITDSNRYIYSDFKLRIRHDRNLATDTTEFTFPGVYYCYKAKSCTKTESRYGSGYDQLPYESNQKYFYDVYKQTIRYSGRDYPTIGSYQSARVTCYKTVSCKFL